MNRDVAQGRPEPDLSVPSAIQERRDQPEHTGALSERILCDTLGYPSAGEPRCAVGCPVRSGEVHREPREAEGHPCEPWCSPERWPMGEVSGGQGREHPRMSTIKFRC